MKRTGCTGGGCSRIVTSFLLYRQLRSGVDAGDIFCRDSVRFRSITDDLIDEAQWRERRDQLIAEARLDILRQPIEKHLDELKDRLETRFAEVNRRIATGENEHFKRKENGRWTLEYPRDGEETNHSFFDQLPQTDLNSVLRFADGQCRFLDAFTHRLGRFAKQSPDKPVLGACIAGWATNTGLPRMGQISDIASHILASASDNFLRLETLREANDIVCNASAALPIFHHYDIGGLVHSSSDGQKFETAVRTFNARHSPKYFGLKKGIVRYTMVANNVPVNARNISADDHESHFVFDIVYNNTTEIQADIHSVDGHGVNHLNAALLLRLRRPVRPALSAYLRQGPHVPDRLPSPEPLRRRHPQARPQGESTRHHSGMGRMLPHLRVPGAEGYDAEYLGPQAEFPRPPEPRQACPLGIRQHP